MNFILRMLLSAISVMAAAYIIPGVTVDGYISALIVAVVLSIFNAILKPILVLLTLPITILTLGLFLLVINIIIVYLASYVVDGFHISGIIAALLFSLFLAIFNSIMGVILKD